MGSNLGSATYTRVCNLEQDVYIALNMMLINISLSLPGK
jgi:hypothetical protein